MKLTAGVLSTAVLAGMFATGIPTKIAAATEHWNDAYRLEQLEKELGCL